MTRIGVRLLDRDRFRRIRVEVDDIPFGRVARPWCRGDEFIGNEVIVVGGKRRARNRRHGLRREELVGNAVFVWNAMAPHFNPQVVSAARGDDGEMFAGELGDRRQLVLHGAELVERAVRFRRQQLLDDSVDGVKGQAAAGEIDLSRRRHDVRRRARSAARHLARRSCRGSGWGGAARRRSLLPSPFHGGAGRSVVSIAQQDWSTPVSFILNMPFGMLTVGEKVASIRLLGATGLPIRGMAWVVLP